MVVSSEARKRANQKWRDANKEYFAIYYRTRYQNDPLYRAGHIAYRKERRDFKREASRIMSIEI